MNKSNYYITTPIYYVNDIPHLGHAYTSIACDALARFKRLDNNNVFFLTGTDEHGQKVEKSATLANKEPKIFTNEVSSRFRELTNILNLSNNDFIRTTEERHAQGVKKIWSLLEEKGDIYLSSYSGWYSVRDEAFFSDKEISIDRNGNKIAPTGAKLDWVEEPSYFFKLSKWQDKLLKFYKNNKDFIQPNSRMNEVIKFVENGLEDLSISRTSFSWGIRVPKNDKHVIYVWLDALTNYISALGWPNNKNDNFDFWPANIHVVGKDILRFHAIYWPAFLMSANIELPKKIFAHGWWTIEGKKMSKSLGNVVDPKNIIDVYGLDQFRYFLLREVPFGQDGDYSKEAMINRINSDLANDLGNLVQRVLSMIQKYFSGKIPTPDDYTLSDKEFMKDLNDILNLVRKDMNKLAFSLALERIWKLIRSSNAYIDREEPWKLHKENKTRRLGTVLYILVERIRRITILIKPFLPDSSILILKQLSQTEKITFDNFYDPIKSGIDLPKPIGIFPRIKKENN